MDSIKYQKDYKASNKYKVKRPIKISDYIYAFKRFHPMITDRKYTEYNTREFVNNPISPSFIE